MINGIIISSCKIGANYYQIIFKRLQNLTLTLKLHKPKQISSTAGIPKNHT